MLVGQGQATEPMRDKNRYILASLSEEEKQSLVKLCRCCCKDDKIPGAHAEKLLTLGLAEMTCGGLGPTSYGRQAAALLRVGHAQG
jgi:hypothetical protein